MVLVATWRGERVAAKVIDHTGRSTLSLMAAWEVALLKSMRHPNVVQVGVLVRVGVKGVICRGFHPLVLTALLDSMNHSCGTGEDGVFWVG